MALRERSQARRQEAEPRQRIGQIAVRGHLRRVCPRADELADWSSRVEAFDVTVEQARFVLLVADGPVAFAPPDLKRHSGKRNLSCPVEGAADLVSARIRGGRPAYLAPREPLQSIAEGQAIERAIARRHVRRCVERRCAGEQSWKPREQKKCFLPTHAAAEGVDTVTVDLQPR